MTRCQACKRWAVFGTLTAFVLVPSAVAATPSVAAGWDVALGSSTFTGRTPNGDQVSLYTYGCAPVTCPQGTRQENGINIEITCASAANKHVLLKFGAYYQWPPLLTPYEGDAFFNRAFAPFKIRSYRSALLPVPLGRSEQRRAEAAYNKAKKGTEKLRKQRGGDFALVWFTSPRTATGHIAISGCRNDFLDSKGDKTKSQVKDDAETLKHFTLTASWKGHD